MGKIVVLFSRGEKSVLLVESRDGGHTWEGVTDITGMVGGGPTLLSVTPGIPGGLRLPNERLVFGIIFSLLSISLLSLSSIFPKGPSIKATPYMSDVTIYLNLTGVQSHRGFRCVRVCIVFAIATLVLAPLIAWF